MRFLHTSDWHLGQNLHQFDRHYEHQTFLDWLLTTLVDEAVDALLIAGDVFDTTNPSSQAQNLLYRFLAEAKQRLPSLQVVITAGNHDSPARLEAPIPLLSPFAVHVVGQVRWHKNEDHENAETQLADLVIPLRDHSGEIAAWCIAIPFLRPADVAALSTLNTNSDNAADAYQQGVAALYAAAVAYVETLRTPEQAIIALGHCQVRGGQVSEQSERQLVIGGAEALPSSIFPPALTYIALGHLHLAQRVGGQEHCRYSGSPLPLSFAEIHYPHQVLCVDVVGADIAQIRSLAVPRPVALWRVPEKPAPLPEVIKALNALDTATLAIDQIENPATHPYLLASVKLDQPEPTLRAEIEAAIADKPVRLARIETTYTLNANTSTTTPALSSLDDLQQLAPASFFARLYERRFNSELPEELAAAFAELLNAPAE